MLDARRNSVNFYNFVIFLVFKIGKPLYNDVQRPPFVAILKVLEAASGLEAEEVWQIAFVVERIIGGIGQNLLLLGGIGRGRVRGCWGS